MIQWPPHSKIICKSLDGKVLAKSRRSRLDLSDELMLYCPEKTLVCVIAVSVNSEYWTTWNTTNVKKIEDHINYDLGFDGYEVNIERISKPGRTLCANPFNWKLEISEENLDDYEDDGECCDTAYAEGFAAGYAERSDENSRDNEVNGSSRKSKAKRFRAANGNATVEKIQSNIEKTFGLPSGSVRLLKPNNKLRTEAGTVKVLRNRWKKYEQEQLRGR